MIALLGQKSACLNASTDKEQDEHRNSKDVHAHGGPSGMLTYDHSNRATEGSTGGTENSNLDWVVN
jgi:hypothetical protein